jgi:heavy metal translocating P-type ATPase
VVSQAGSCDLCGLKTGGKPVVRTFDGVEKRFCCEGCARVYQVALENDMLDQVLPHLEPKQARWTETILERGQTSHFSIEGMWCAGCGVAAEQLLRKQPGVTEADISFAAERGRIRYDPAQVEPSAVLKKLDGFGYRARLLGDPAERGIERRQERALIQLVIAAAFGMQVMLLYLVELYPMYGAGRFDDPELRKLQYLAWALATPVLFFGGISFLQGAWRAVRAGTATMDTLVALGTLSAYGYSVYVTLTGSGEAYFDSVAMITTFIMIGRYLELIGGAQARKDIRRLLRLQPDRAWRRVGEDWQEVEAKALARGDEILVKAGERVPADAEIVEGQGALDESLLTGESMPVNKGPGDIILAGTILTDAALIARVPGPPQDTRLARVTKLVEQTLATKPPIQRLADRASGYFAVGILGVAILTAIGWGRAGFPGPEALLAAIAVLVVACPCALGLATPLALTVTLGQTTQAGILIRNPVALETAARIRRMVFDKTGTLTLGRLVVVSEAVEPQLATTNEELVCLAAAVERHSEHPVAKAIVEACRGPIPRAREFQALRGLGASAVVQVGADQRVLVGSLRFVNVDGHSPLAQEAQAHAERGETVVWVGWDSGVAGFIALRDELNPTALAALRQLQKEGVGAVVLSGDNPRTTQAVATELGLSEYEGNYAPQEKTARIREWQAAGELVAMVGDGVNDAPALAQADLSIATAGGTDVAGETSDVVLTRSDLTLIPWLIRLSRRTRRIILQNLGWAFAYNLVSVPLAALGVISPVIAAAAMATSSLLVVGNSLRLRRIGAR